MNTIERPHRNAGFTLIELMIAVFVLAIVMMGVFNLFAKNSKAHVSQEITLELTQDLRAALNLMTTEIRMAGYDSVRIGGVGFLDDADDRYDTDGNSIRFTMDLNDGTPNGLPNGDVTDTGEDVNYYVDLNGDLIRRINGSTTPVEAVAAGNITNLTFTYLDGNNAATAVLANVRSLGISLTGRTRIVDPLLKQFKTRTETARIKVRNLGL